jgi:hypothetical protein
MPWPPALRLGPGIGRRAFVLRPARVVRDYPLVQHQDKIADVDLVAPSHHRGPGYAPAVDIGAIGALLIHDHVALVFEEQPRVMLGNVVFRQAQLVIVKATDADFRLVKVQLLLGSAFFRDDDGKHRFALNAAGGA